jgi:UDP:flavonoid glycosyltransferase YjiC (YdhE family)
MMLMIGLELIGLKAQPKALQTNHAGRELSKGNCIIMFPTNGVGFGHFTRLLAIGKRMKKQDPSLEIIFFTTMPTLHLLKPYGIPAHHISGPKYFKGVDSNEWNALLEEELTLCIETHNPSMFIFDGAFPYRGMLRAIYGRIELKKIWMRRGMFRKGAKIPVDSIQHFDSIIRPGDGIDESEEEIDHGLEILRSPPIIMLDESELLSREKARYRLGIPQDCQAVYVQLGAGEINDISSEIRMTLEELLEHEKIHVILGESLIGSRIEVELPKVHILRDYPNSQYFNGFDAVIQAGGYNSFHETRAFGLPALFYPNLETGMDDQLARCLVAEAEGWGYVVEKRTQENIRVGIQNLLNHINKGKSLENVNGADELSKALIANLEAS